MIEIIGDGSAAESAEADQGGRDTGEGQEMLGLALVAAVQATAPKQPRHRWLHGPPVAAQLLGGLDGSAGEVRGDVARAKPSPQVVVVVAFVSMELGGPPSARPAPGTNGGMPRTRGSSPWLSCVFAAEIPIERGRPVRSVIKWIFEPFLPRSAGFGPVKSPLRRAHVHRVDRAPRPVQLASGAGFVQDQAVEFAPHTGLAPLGEAAVRSRPGRAEARRQLPPRAACRGHEHYGRRHLSVPIPASAPTLRPHRSGRHHPLEQLPQRVRHQTLHHRHHGTQPDDHTR